ncbi:hypothetical protein [Pontibacter burrus]|uniref:Lipoprotein n=1 Tax=Pontibacter burrus TaxID=2704466 RepID=A0A6B3LYG4_9BACT|nr:hypothetical protein [Pontibacter burrus]NEM99386.1 hypothetical protein [Pontibacter burrus]
MKKILYPLAMATAILFTACSEDRGTSTEVVNANPDEKVNPMHLSNYNRPGTEATSTASTLTGSNMNNSGAQAVPANQTLTAEELVRSYYNDNNPVEYYHFNATARLAGLAQDTSMVNKNRTSTTLGNNSNNNQNNTTMVPSSTTADGQGTSVTQKDKLGSGTNKNNTTKNKTNQTDKKKERLTLENDN